MRNITCQIGKVKRFSSLVLPSKACHTEIDRGKLGAPSAIAGVDSDCILQRPLIAADTGAAIRETNYIRAHPPRSSYLLWRQILCAYFRSFYAHRVCTMQRHKADGTRDHMHSDGRVLGMRRKYSRQIIVLKSVGIECGPRLVQNEAEGLMTH
ncbi:hypothetical protein PILCRDRAFT_481960 [Piloderma croceum F 1598]|uniref:Uncharacterized protein n=1 Tax=Piloderma croceum (strain F 1598) TaxID=765440 RepID=A0A0C3BX52_PILCF|nr:hypothetical protein PILCRDRAFT_481960 [Piloderma croceum F 1598]